MELLVGHRFSDRRLLVGATSTSARAFGSLESLGDAIADFAVALTCWHHGTGPGTAAAMVSNAALDRVFRSRLRGRVDATSGDVVESLIGGVHLDAGFDAAASLAVRWCCDGLAWVPLGEADVSDFVPVDDVVVPASLAANALDALVTDLIVARIGPTSTTQKMIHRNRVRVVDGSGRSRLARSLGLHSRSRGRTGGAGSLREVLVTTLLAAGWDRTKVLVGPHIDLTHLHSGRLPAVVRR